jgi:hypothetical protein
MRTKCQEGLDPSDFIERMAMCQYRSLDDFCTVYKREPLLQPFMYAIIY